MAEPINIPIKDGATNTRQLVFTDTVGGGTGPFLPVHGLHDATNNADALGQVITSPDPNTILGRLKAIADAINNAVVADAIPYKNLSVTDKTEIKDGAGLLYWLNVMNMSASVRYLKFYNAAAADVTVGTTTPVFTFPIPTLGTTNGMGFTMHFPNGVNFDTGITVAATTDAADNSSSLAGSNQIILNLGFS